MKLKRLAAFSIVSILAAGPNAAWMCGTTCDPIPEPATCHQPFTSSARLTAASHCPTIGIPAVAAARDEVRPTFAASVGMPLLPMTPSSPRLSTTDALRYSAQLPSPAIPIPLRV